MSVTPEGTVTNPVPNSTGKIEPKVQWATIATYVVGVLALALVNLLTANQNELLIEALPDWLEAFIIPIVPALTTLVVGYNARHQWRRAEITGPPTSDTTLR
jgi:cytochrome bd-type quinol oxidase subunit 2